VKVTGISMVRNEADVVELSILHHLRIGCDDVLVVDNGSTDGTVAILRELSRIYPVLWTKDEGPYRQSEVMTGLARDAARGGADWVVPFDADEFWWVRGGCLRDSLERRSSEALRSSVVNFVQRRAQYRSSPHAVARMTYRAPTAGTAESARELVEAGEIGFVEIVYPPKHVARASPTLEIATGNHSIGGSSGPAEEANDILCLHAPLRSREGLLLKTAMAARVFEQYPDPSEMWQTKRWGHLAEQHGLDEEWAANSHSSGCLDLPDGRRPLVYDATLRHAVAPLMPLHRKLWTAVSSRFGELHRTDSARRPG
jgi:Glycosyl transferase family 2